ncbi:MAG: condensation domain-containing protein, partial [Acidobacteria bacterium]|nr:condensation domain-containing protein [Acidobacteriota bacterium]
MEKLESHHIENIFALTHLQEGIFFHYLKDRQNNNLYFEQLSLKITGAINRQHVENAWNAVIKTNEMLRVVFRWEKMEKPSQIILKRHSCILKFHDLSDIENDQKETLLLKIKKDDRNEGFDLNLVPFRIILCKMAEEQYVMIISNHHILYDGWSNGIILKEFFQVYHERIKGNLSFKLPAKPSFKEFIKWMQNLDRKKTEKYWSNYLAGFETTTEIPVKRKKAGTIGTRDYTIILEMDIQSKLDIFVKNNRVTLASIFYTAWGILLQRYCASEDVIFGTTVSGRSVGIKGIEDMVGLFINTVPLRIYSNPGETIINAVTRIDNVLHEREEFEHTPLVDIGGSKLLFDTILVIENYPLDNHLLPVNSPISVQSYAMVETTHYDLVIGIMPFNEIEIKFSFKQDLFDNDAIENMAGHFKTIIQKIITQPETVLSQIEIISIDEKNRLLYDFNNKGKAYPEYRGIQQIFEDQLGKIPGKIALVSSFHHITYKNFNENADHLGWILKNKGVGPNCLVGLMIERSIEMMIGLFGILKAGGAYLPIDSDYPPERVLYMLEDSQIQLTVTNRKCRKLTCSRQFPGEFIDIENIDSPIDKINQKAPRMFDDRSDLIYMIYTSGSTGKPKGVIIQKEGFSNLLRWYIEEFGIGGQRGGKGFLWITRRTNDRHLKQKGFLRCGNLG